MAVGQIYTTVEEGWLRINPANSNITYYNFNGTNTTTLSPNTARFVYPVQANGSTRDDNLHIDSNFPHKYATAKFNFTGTKLRILLGWPHYSVYSENASIYIDGKYVGKPYTPATRNSAGPYQHYWCCFEKTDLSDKEHTFIMVVEPKSGTLHLAAFDIDENATVSASTLDNTAQLKSILGDGDIIANNLKAGHVITGKYIECNSTAFGYFCDLRISNTPIEKSYKSGAGTNIAVKTYFDFYQAPEDPKLYELTNTDVKFYTTRDLVVTDGTAETINPSYYKQVLNVDFEEHKLSVIPKDIILKTKYLIPTKDVFSSVTCILPFEDQYARYLISTDNENFFTYDASSSSWIAADPADIDDVGITDFKTIPFEACETFFGGTNTLGIIVKLGIEDPDDIAFYDDSDRVFKNFKFTEGNLDLANVESSARTVNFYFTKAEGPYNNNLKNLICDTVLNKGISWTNAATLNGDGLNYTNSNYDVQAYVQLIDSLEDDDDYTDYVLADPKFDVSDKELTWVKNGANLTNNEDFIARGDANTTETHTINDKAVEYENIGIRPQILFNTRPKTYHRVNSDTCLPVVTKVKELAPGKAIACWYKATTSGTAGGSAAFKIGKNGKSIIPDTGTATPDGYFYWICVGYAPSGALLCIADRNIQTNISWEALNNVGYCVHSGIPLKFGSANNCLIRLPATTSTTPSGWKNMGEWDEYISYYGQNGITPSANAVWNATSWYSWTMTTPTNAMGNRIIRGCQDETNVSNEYVQTSVSSSTVRSDIGFRPIMEIQLYVDETQVTTYPECNLKIARSIGSCKPGQAIVCEYSASSGAAGGSAAFVFNPDSGKDLISDPAPAAPDGKFYFVCVGYGFNGFKTFIADRNIQTNISWEALNNVGYCVSSGIDVSARTGFPSSLIRLPISDVTNYNMYIDSSEWDLYIMREYIGNTKISASGCNYFNMKKTFSWMCNTPHDVNASGNAANMSYRVVRGKETIDYQDEANFVASSVTANTNIGFRPVLEVYTNDKTADHFAKINHTHVNEKNSANDIIDFDGTVELYDETLTAESFTVKMLINGVENLDFDPTIVTNETNFTYHYDLALSRLDYGDNTIRIIVTTTNDDESTTANTFDYTIERENLSQLSKVRDVKAYTTGYDLGTNLLINGDKNTINNYTKVKFDESPEVVRIPKNVTSITFTAS